MTSLTKLRKPDSDAHSRVTRGRLVARLLSGAWRPSSPPTSDSFCELEDIAALLIKSGAAGLAWCKVRRSEIRSAGVADQLHQVYRLQSLQAALHERRLMEVIPLLRSVGIEAMLVKGWAIARLYPEAGMRPYCDLDLCVTPDDYAKAATALKDVEGEGTNIDLHSGFGKFYDRRMDAIFALSRLEKLDDIDVRVLCEEDNLRYLCMHLLRHGAVRPLWLCDIAVALESRSPAFDWDRCLSGSHRQADWVACAIGLAAQLLGADVEQTPIAQRAQRLPAWLVNSVLSDWGVPFRSPRQVRTFLQQPVKVLAGLPAELLRHWPNPIEATMTLQGPLNRIPRLPFQIGHVISRTTALLSELIGTSKAIHHRS